MRAVGALVLAALSVASAAAAQSERAKPTRDATVGALALDARAAPPEFSADVLLRLAASSRVADPEWRRELLEEAYLRAYAASDAYRLTATSTRFIELTRSADRTLVLDLLENSANRVLALYGRVARVLGVNRTTSNF